MNSYSVAPAGLLGLTLSLCVACGGIAPAEHGPKAGGHVGGNAETSGGGTAPANAAPPTPAVVATDSNTLRVTVSVAVMPSPGMTQETVDVRILVYVAESASGAPVLDAQVTGGPIGHTMPLAFGQPLIYSGAPHYGGWLTGYDRVWELSVVRGADYVKRAVLVGPSYPSITMSAGPGGAIVGWSPAAEANVTTSVCLWGAGSGAPGKGEDIHEGWCDQGQDEGFALLSSANQVPAPPTVPLPTPGESYWVQLLERLANVSVDAQGGSAEFDLGVDANITVAPCG